MYKGAGVEKKYSPEKTEKYWSVKGNTHHFGS